MLKTMKKIGSLWRVSFISTTKYKPRCPRNSNFIVTLRGMEWEQEPGLETRETILPMLHVYFDDEDIPVSDGYLILGYSNT